jgi:hypothetical protein
LPLIQPGSSVVQYWDSLAQAHYAYDSTNQIFYSYDTPASINAKSAYVISQDLAGIFGWESSGDTLDFSLINAMSAALEPLITDDSGFWNITGHGSTTSLSSTEIFSTSISTQSPTPTLLPANEQNTSRWVSIGIGFTVAGFALTSICIYAWIMRQRLRMKKRSQSPLPESSKSNHVLRLNYVSQEILVSSIVRRNSATGVSVRSTQGIELNPETEDQESTARLTTL